MNKAERAALTALLDNVGLGFTKCLAECKLLRAYLQRTQPRLTVKAASTPVVITLSLATCAQAPVTTKAPAADSAFDPAALDAANTYLAPISIPNPLASARVHWISEGGLVMTSERMAERPEGRFKPWAYTWVALAAKVKTKAPAKKAKAKR